ncbi:Elongation of very long chain fatty acids protein 7 [Halotydeus destructor]|nr:Elongation of very long chain fatty acids protein 7 [Halotydeus destructor]
MAAFLSDTFSQENVNYALYGFWDKYGDPTGAHLPMMSGGPWTIGGLVGAYLLFVKLVGPWYMRNRKPFELRRAMIVYNLVNVILNALGFLVAFYYTNFGLDVWGCRQGYYSPFLLYLGYGYILMKFFDFMDTIFFVLRKKDRHVSFLHVTHHSLMPFTCYIGMKFVPYGNTAFTPLINSLVHTVMYFYYYLAALGPHMARHLWWKKYITVLQLVQFAIGIVHSLHVYIVPNCTYPRWVSSFELAEALYFFVVFFRFYRRTYSNVRTKVTKDKST